MANRSLKLLIPYVQFVYRATPLPASLKSRIKSLFMRTFAFALSDTGIYQRWKAYEETKRISIYSTTLTAAQRKLRARSSTGNRAPGLPVADGDWEWADYAAIHARIKAIEKHRRYSFSPSKVPLISIDEDLFRAAARVRIPPGGEKPDVSIVIPAFNHVKLTLECLLSISKYPSKRTKVEIIVADDASTDETVDVLNRIPNIKVRSAERNQGFLLNCNGVLDEVRGRFVVFLNNDVQVTEGWLEALVKTFDDYDRVGAVGPRLIYPSGHLQEAGAAILPDGTAGMAGLGGDPDQPRFQYCRRVDYCSGACLMVPTELMREVGGFSGEFAPSYCEDSDLCLKLKEAGFYTYFNPAATVVHHLSRTMSSIGDNFKQQCIANNLVTFTRKWQKYIDSSTAIRSIAFYLPQFHPIPENNNWWGKGFTEWTNVAKARPNFVGHDQPRVPADLGFYDLRCAEVLNQQAELAKRYGIYGFCYYYYWFNGKRLLEMPIERMLRDGEPNMPFCLCWANENWTRRWDGRDQEILIAQSYSDADDEAVIGDFIRYFRDERYIRIDGRPLLLVYRVTLFPDFASTAHKWREICHKQGIGDIYIAMVESFELVHKSVPPQVYGCDAAVEFPPHGIAKQHPPTGSILNPDFKGALAEYSELATTYGTREIPSYTRFRCVVPRWDNTPRRQNDGFCFEGATPGSFQAWAEAVIEQTRIQHCGDERIIFVNAWNEWAEGAYLEPDMRFGHTFLEALRNALEASKFVTGDAKATLE